MSVHFCAWNCRIYSEIFYKWNLPNGIVNYLFSVCVALVKILRIWLKVWTTFSISLFVVATITFTSFRRMNFGNELYFAVVGVMVTVTGLYVETVNRFLWIESASGADTIRFSFAWTWWSLSLNDTVVMFSLVVFIVKVHRKL